MPYFIVITNRGKKAVIAHSNGEPREFHRRKSARNYINARSWLWDEYEITTDIANIKRRERVN